MSSSARISISGSEEEVVALATRDHWLSTRGGATDPGRQGAHSCAHDVLANVSELGLQDNSSSVVGASPRQDYPRHHVVSWRADVRRAAGSARSDAGRMGTRVLTHVAAERQDSLPAALGSPSLLETGGGASGRAARRGASSARTWLEARACPEGKDRERVGCRSNKCTCGWSEQCFPRLVLSNETGAKARLDAGVCGDALWLLVIDSILMIAFLILSFFCIRFSIIKWQAAGKRWEKEKAAKRRAKPSDFHVDSRC